MPRSGKNTPLRIVTFYDYKIISERGQAHIFGKENYMVFLNNKGVVWGIVAATKDLRLK